MIQKRIKPKATSLLVVASLFAFLFIVHNPSVTYAQGSSTEVFYVAWYDVGKAALDGLNGILNVKKGWKNGREINTVSYDPTRISIQEMEAILKQAGTFRGRANWSLSHRFLVNAGRKSVSSQSDFS